MEGAEDRARKILKTLDRLERRRQRPKLFSWIPWILALLLVLAITCVIIANRGAFAALWGRLMRPDAALSPGS